MPQSGIYAIVNEITEDFYIGSSKNIESRLNGHFKSLQKGNHANSFLQRSFNKYGEEAFTTRIIEITNDFLAREQFWINELQPTYNLKIVVDDKWTVSEETRQRIREASKKVQSETGQFKKLGEENRKRIAESRKNQPLDEKRSKQLEDARKIKAEKGTSDETRKKLSEINMGHEVSQKTRNKLAKTWKDKNLSLEHKQAIKDGLARRKALKQQQNNTETTE